MSAGWVGFIAGCLIGSNMGIILAALLAAAARKAACQRAYIAGLAKGNELGRANAFASMLATNAAVPGTDREAA